MKVVNLLRTDVLIVDWADRVSEKCLLYHSVPSARRHDQ